MYKYNLTILSCLSAAMLVAQSPKTADVSLLAQTPVIDGRLTDSCWQTLTPIGDFQTAAPVFGEMPHCKTDVRLFYTETALYVAAWCYDPDAGGVRADGGNRDGQATGDWFRVSLDTWNDDQLSFDFTVTAAGVQLDSRQGSANWDAFWQSAVARQADGWTVEIRIPFMALRFPRVLEQDWGAQFTRYDRSSGETSTWSPQDPLIGDRALQFGALRGIRNIIQQRRLSLALQSQTYAETRYKPFEFGDITETIGIDGRIGLNESSTLDFTIMPARTIDLNTPGVFSAPLVFGNVDLPEPRQFREEERDLFGKNGNLDESPDVSSLSFLHRLKLTPGTFFVNYDVSKPIQTTKYTARTKGNWRFGAYNALLGPVKADIYNIATSELMRDHQFQGLSDYHYLTAEYLLPNNGYVNVSTGNLLAGSDYFSTAPAVRFRLRDRSNAYELRGNTNFSFLQRDTAQYLNNTFALGLSRINRRWGWSVDHRENALSLKAPESTPKPDRNGATSARIQYRDFRPHGSFLNLNGYAGVDIAWTDNEVQPNPWYLSVSLSALDRRFQNWSWTATTRPYSRITRYTNSGGAYIDREIAPSLSSSVSYRSDTRKPFQWAAYMYGSTTTAGEFWTVQPNLNASWVFHPKFRIQGDLWGRGDFDMLKLLNAPGRWIFERSDKWTATGELGLYWSPSRRLFLWGTLSTNQSTFSRRETVELELGGQLTPADWPLPDPGTQEDNTSFTVGGQFYFSAISQLRLQYTHGDVYQFRFSPGGPTYEPVPQGATYLTLILNLDRANKR